MGRSAVVSVGDEVLAGRIDDTNATWLCRRLREEGFPVGRRETVGDIVEQIAEAVQRLTNLFDAVVVGGGLGPTEDDLTRAGVARALGVGLVSTPETEALVREYFERSGRTMTDANRVQALLPAGTRPIVNARGTAPGIWHEADGRILAVLPGVPHELRGMMEEEVLPRLRSHPARGAAPRVRRLTIAGIGESDMGARIRDLMARGRNPAVGSYPATGEIQLVIEAEAAAPEAADRLLDADEAEIRNRLGGHVVAEGGLSIAEAVGRRLLELRTTLATAESITGGRVTDLLVAIPGISAVLQGGIVAYSDAVKRSVLGVPEAVFAEVGAVSERCAAAMAEGARQLTGADVAVSTTGIAGPTGAVPGKPVGTVVAAVADARGTLTERRQIPGDRLQVRERAAVLALDLLRRRLPAGP